MAIVALTGGIASGKSTIARFLRERGAIIVDADQIVRDVQQPGAPVLTRIAEEFGDEMINVDGTLDRARLGAAVFGDPDAVARLNEIVHPAVRTEAARQFKAAFAQSPDAIVVYDVPLLAETRIEEPWDLVIVAHAPAPMRRQRLIVQRGMSEAAADARINSQVSDDARLAIADVVVDTSGTMEATAAQVAQVWNQLTASA
ncbi:dephospho-CoA kinase [Microbacterium marmarense]|uniref:Dephospho-CoA kinase n=1 Tax=Microbacterium marmarense TaxID=3122051 RepID=A0ABU8LTX8_9MICO